MFDDKLFSAVNFPIFSYLPDIVFLRMIFSGIDLESIELYEAINVPMQKYECVSL